MEDLKKEMKIAENFAKKGNKVFIISSDVFAGNALGIPSTILKMAIIGS
ncbi:MAG: hypothetical protein ACE5J3_09745 [Methanosarcinales archaeon]